MMHYGKPIMRYCGSMISHRGLAMAPSDRGVATSYKLSIVTMCPPAAVWLQF